MRKERGQLVKMGSLVSETGNGRTGVKGNEKREV